ncbi:MAG TPA: hypothetical protein VGO33_14825 [Gemmatimonadaceae bacterium]|jgi:hypothetical protein|nr:hypothetical protein [Gemmatimonadaceae bacterium]
MSAKQTFVQHYQKAIGRSDAPQGLIKAGCLYVLDLKVAGFSQDEVTGRLQDLIASAGGMIPDTARLDADIMLHCIEEYHRPVPPARPKPPEFLG